jgi:autonomous glycyl radical cofactor GrcA
VQAPGERRRDGDVRAEEPGSVRDAGRIESSRRAAVLRQLTLTFIKNRETRTVVRFDVQVQGGQIVGFAVLRKSTLEQINNPQGFSVVLNPP